MLCKFCGEVMQEIKLEDWLDYAFCLSFGRWKLMLIKVTMQPFCPGCAGESEIRKKEDAARCIPKDTQIAIF